MQRIIKHFRAIYLFFFVISGTVTSEGRSENSDQSGPLHPMLPNANPIKRALAFSSPASVYGSPSKKARRSTSDTIEYLKERNEAEFALRREQLELKKKEQEEKSKKDEEAAKRQEDLMKMMVQQNQITSTCPDQ